MMETLEQAFTEALTALGRSTRVNTSEAIAEWEEFVAKCAADGYDEPDYEFYNDRAIRGHLDVLLSLISQRPGLVGPQEAASIEKRIADADRIWLAASQIDPRADASSPDWARAIPALISGEFADDVARMRRASGADREVGPMPPVDWDSVSTVVWEPIEAVLLDESSVEASGLAFSVVDDDGLDFEVAAFRLPKGVLAALVRGVGGPTSAWTVCVEAGEAATAREILDAVGLPPRVPGP